MIIYIVKTIVLSLIFYGFYAFFLSKEKTFTFNRIYLLGSLIIVFLIPFITIQIPNNEIISQNIEPVIFPETHQINTSEVIEKKEVNYTQYFLYFYAFVCLILLIKFSMNIYSIYRLKGKTTILNGRKFKLLSQNIGPFSFLNTIYISKQTYDSIDEKIIQHEACHVQQKHSWDILLVELLFCLYWINPIILLFKKSIKQNHEFLADELVVSQNPSQKKGYQLLILNELKNTNSSVLVNPFYTNIKNRLIMMNKTKSRKNWKPYLSLPLLAILVGLGSERVFATAIPQQEITSALHLNDTPIEEFKKALSPYQDLIDQKKYSELSKQITSKEKEKLGEIYDQLTNEEKKQFSITFIKTGKLPKTKVTSEQLKDFTNAKKYGVWVDGKKVTNASLKNYQPQDFSQADVSKRYPNAISKKNPEPFQLNLMTNKYYETYIKEESSYIMGFTSKMQEIREKAQKAKENTQENQEDIIPAEFPGGNNAFRIKISEILDNSNIKTDSKCEVKFIVDENGIVKNFEAVGENTDFNNEAVKAVKKATENIVWKPATKEGKAVDYNFKMPFKIMVPKDDK